MKNKKRTYVQIGDWEISWYTLHNWGWLWTYIGILAGCMVAGVLLAKYC